MDELSQAFEVLVKNILESNGFIFIEGIESMSKLDYIVEFDGQKWAVEVKYYRTKRAQPVLIENAAKALIKTANKYNLEKAMLIVSSYIEPQLRLSLEKKFELNFIDRTDLSIWANQTPQFFDQLAKFLEESPTGNDRAKIKINQNLSISNNDPSLAKVNQGDMLCKELRQLGKGKKYWGKYEKLCKDILNYLFPNDLMGWHKQKRTDDGLNRYDLICRITPTTDFWSFVDSQLNSRYVLFEFKNYTSQIKQGQILTTEKYLLPRALRRLGIILCRKGADKNARLTIAGAMRESGKMMLALNDDDICNLLHAKDMGEDPSDLLFEMADDFLMGLNR